MICASCIFYDFLGADCNKLPKDSNEKLADNHIQGVFHEIQTELRKKYPLSIMYQRGEENEKKLKIISVGFVADTSLFLNQDKSRELIVYCTEVMLKILYQDKGFQSYFKNMPFTYKNLAIIIFLIDPCCQDVKYEKPIIYLTGMENGLITYAEKDLSKPFKSHPKVTQKEFLKNFNILEESYEEALKIVQAQSIETTPKNNQEGI